ncbi:hypothetical protein BDR04DRAFT_1151528 [Suillus decipiens]|nr:hypothetical protein BDR04DRAFT_1151528 [Suillus decipiens]
MSQKLGRRQRAAPMDFFWPGLEARSSTSPPRALLLGFFGASLLLCLWFVRFQHRYHQFLGLPDTGLMVHQLDAHQQSFIYRLPAMTSRPSVNITDTQLKDIISEPR